MSLPPRWHCSIQSSSNAKADSCGVALWLFSIFPSWGLTADLLVKVTDTAIKDLVLIFMFITECWTRGKRAGWAQKDIWAHRHTDGCCPHPAALVSRKAGEAEKLQEICLSGLPRLLLLASISTWTVQELALTTLTPFQSNSMPVYFASISHLLLRIVRTSPIREEGKGQIFPSFVLGTFPREQLTLDSANTFMSLRLSWYLHHLSAHRQFPVFLFVLLINAFYLLTS